MYLSWAKYFDEGEGKNNLYGCLLSLMAIVFSVSELARCWITELFFFDDSVAGSTEEVGIGAMVPGSSLCTSGQVLKEHGMVRRTIRHSDLRRCEFPTIVPLRKVWSTFPNAC